MPRIMEAHCDIAIGPLVGIATPAPRYPAHHARAARSRDHPPRPRAAPERPQRHRRRAAPPGPALADPAGDRARRCRASSCSAVRRRAKYLLLDTEPGSALLHLGMSGALRVLPAKTPVEAHDHVDLALDSGRVLRFTDPRRFGCLLWQPAGDDARAARRASAPSRCRTDFDGDYLFERSRGRSAPVKTFLMDQAHRGRRRQHLRGRERCSAPASPRRAPRAACRASATCGWPTAVKHILAHAIDARRHDPARLHRPRRRAGLFRAGAAGLRPRRRSPAGAAAGGRCDGRAGQPRHRLVHRAANVELPTVGIDARRRQCGYSVGSPAQTGPGER